LLVGGDLLSLLGVALEKRDPKPSVCNELGSSAVGEARLDVVGVRYPLEVDGDLRAEAAAQSRIEEVERCHAELRQTDENSCHPGPVEKLASGDSLRIFLGTPRSRPSRNRRLENVTGGTGGRCRTGEARLRLGDRDESLGLLATKQSDVTEKTEPRGNGYRDHQTRNYLWTHSSKIVPTGISHG
jgi:hypothetical protein